MIESIIKELNRIEEKKLATDVIIAYSKKTIDIGELDNLARLAYENKLQYASRVVTEKQLDIAINSKLDKSIIDDIQYNLVNVLIACNEPELALNIIGNDLTQKSKISHCHYLLGHLDKAEKILLDILYNDNPDEKELNDILFNLGTYNLWRGNFQLGLEQFLKYNKSTWNSNPLPFTKWNGQDISGKTLLVKSEAGLGDEIINVRFVKHLRDRGIKPVWLTDRSDVRDVLTRHSIDTIYHGVPNELDTFWCGSMMLPLLLKIQSEDLWSGPYLSPIKTNILHSNFLKIGLRWQGNQYFDNDLHRSLSLISLINSMPQKCLLYSLQRDSGLEELEEYNKDSCTPVYALHKSTLNTLEETMSVIDELDIVVTSCTSIAHISAAMGKRTIVMVPLSTYYVWCNPNGTQPWYGDNVTVIRQETPRNWDKPLLKLKELLNA